MATEKATATGLEGHPSDNIAVGRREVAEQGKLDAKEASMEAAAKGQAISGFETLGLWETVKAFKVCTATCFLVAFSAATDGYQIGMNGNIIANPGFVRQFATETNDAGEPFLASPILSAWGIHHVSRPDHRHDLPAIPFGPFRPQGRHVRLLVRARHERARGIAGPLVARLARGQAPCRHWCRLSAEHHSDLHRRDSPRAHPRRSPHVVQLLVRPGQLLRPRRAADRGREDGGSA
ncbi:hypothetical protein HYQ44_005940 [Verticillium longisporum]|nr:hypothetical protein HYQ44_005940 [Verticillium longisporum]